MAALSLESLVLRGSVRVDALGYLRLGTSEKAGQTSDNPDGPNPSVAVATQGTCPGAGRSRRHARCLTRSRTEPTTPATLGWRPTGGPAAAAAAKRRALFAGLVASAGEISPMGGRISALPVRTRSHSS